MGSAAARRFTLDDYWAVEMASPVRHEFLQGTIFAMAGGTVRHNEVASNLLQALGAALREAGCHPIGADQRIRVSPTEYTYADVSVFCDRIVVAAGNPPDTATNPTIVVEVLSPSTRGYDTTDKLAMYQRIPTVTEILLVEPEDVSVTRWIRGPGGWSAETFADPAGHVPVHGHTVAMAEIYARRVT